jgi:hypothetical protein
MIHRGCMLCAFAAKDPARQVTGLIVQPGGAVSTPEPSAGGVPRVAFATGIPIGPTMDVSRRKMILRRAVRGHITGRRSWSSRLWLTLAYGVGLASTKLAAGG